MIFRYILALLIPHVAIALCGFWLRFIASIFLSSFTISMFSLACDSNFVLWQILFFIFWFTTVMLAVSSVYQNKHNLGTSAGVNNSNVNTVHVYGATNAPASVASELVKLAELHKSGHLTDEEFQIQKSKILNA